MHASRALKFIEKSSMVSYVLVFLTASVIFYFSSLTSKQTSNYGFEINAILYHLIIFFFLGFFLAVSFAKGVRPKRILGSIILASVYAISDEIHQMFVEGRSSSFSDFCLDLAGISTASFLYILILYRRNHQQNLKV